MNPHAAVILVGFLVCAGAILIAMSLIASTTHDAPKALSEVQPRGYRLRRGWLWALAAATVAAFGISLVGFPYGAPAASSGPHYSVIAFQYGFQTPPEIPLNTPVVFDVTSRDVNHGFGIYDPANHLMSQVQAMPEYVNHLALTFQNPGHYTVRCLEYCGIAHAAMQGGFEVK
ncbi:MAG: cytochrome C oxidase subunit II [Candidatus Eremiobacteraeota bacterium]|nr:cytochrome C oxidase subunit II [Candidatus Eremiobacteraeota bacterium]